MTDTAVFSSSMLQSKAGGEEEEGEQPLHKVPPSPSRLGKKPVI